MLVLENLLESVTLVSLKRRKCEVGLGADRVSVGSVRCPTSFESMVEWLCCPDPTKWHL